MGADELEDYLDLRDPKVKRSIQKSYQEYRAGKGRPIEEFLSELHAEPKTAKVARRTHR